MYSVIPGASYGMIPLTLAKISSTCDMSASRYHTLPAQSVKNQESVCDLNALSRALDSMQTSNQPNNLNKLDISFFLSHLYLLLFQQYARLTTRTLDHYRQTTQEGPTAGRRASKLGHSLAPTGSCVFATRR
jgi:hypothetical protein